MIDQSTFTPSHLGSERWKALCFLLHGYDKD